MKKLFLGLLIIYTSIAYAKNACTSYDSHAFNIVINNNTGEICTLLTHTLNNGLYSTEKRPPKTLMAGEKSQPLQLTIPVYVLGTYYLLSANIELSYQCGSDKFVTIESQKSLFPGDKLLGVNDMVTITGSISTLSNMDAKYFSTRGSCEKNQSSTLEWTFY